MPTPILIRMVPWTWWKPHFAATQFCRFCGDPRPCFSDPHPIQGETKQDLHPFIISTFHLLKNICYSPLLVLKGIHFTTRHIRKTCSHGTEHTYLKGRFQESFFKETFKNLGGTTGWLVSCTYRGLSSALQSDAGVTTGL